LSLNIEPTAFVDGIVYGSAVPLTSTEATLHSTLAFIPIVYGQEIVAVVRLSINGFVTGNSTYVVMQTDLGDDTWIDVAWVFWNQVQGSATFVLIGGGRGAMNNAFQQSRNAGQVPQPQANGSNQMSLGGRVRFVGRTVMTSGSSSAPGVSTVVVATITYKLTTPR